MRKVGGAILTIIKILVFFIGWAVLAGVTEIPADDPALWRFFAEAAPLGIMLIFTLIFILIERGKVKIPVFKNGLKGGLTGLCAGAVWLGLSAGIVYLTGQMTFRKGAAPEKLWLWILAALMNVIMQELMIRGYIYRLLRTKWNLPAAIIITTALFVFLHGGIGDAGPVAVINTATMCLFTAFLYESEGTILAPIAAHAVWNVVGAIILGAVNLAEDYPSLTVVFRGEKALISGGAKKLEGSIIVTVINLLLAVLFFIKYLRKRKKEKQAAAVTEEAAAAEAAAEKESAEA